MATVTDVRKAALSHEGVSEVDHWGRPSWRTKRRIFAVMRPDGLFLNLPEERKEFLFAAAPDAFVKFMWGKTANVIVQIALVPKTELDALIREAFEHNRPAEKSSAKKALPKTVAKKPARKSR